jgi:hypothetical protein
MNPFKEEGKSGSILFEGFENMERVKTEQG